ncbi:DUF6216 family protein [Xanthomonas citri]|uniref:DUF6216 family protein n=1 Tax=Xanthomonas citri TaxID=346 RepID=UPI0028BD5AB7|nr:DUF6216 family protein [Xanthomonas citri]
MLQLRLSDGANQEILCEVWADPTLKPHLAKEVPKQRHASLFAFAVALWCAWQFYTLFRELISANKLKDLLEERQLGASR